MGQRVNEVRRRLGINLAREHPVKADVLVPVPDSAIPAGLGYSVETGIPLDFGLLKNRYIHRTFIRPAQNLRESGVRLKLNPIPEVLKNRSVAVLDDSIVRGTTARQIVAMIRECGATQVHFLVSSPPIKFPDFYGIDTPKPDELAAASMLIEETRKHIGADSLAYLSYGGMIDATVCRKADFPVPALVASIQSRSNLKADDKSLSWTFRGLYAQLFKECAWHCIAILREDDAKVQHSIRNGYIRWFEWYGSSIFSSGHRCRNRHGTRVHDGRGP